MDKNKKLTFDQLAERAFQEWLFPEAEKFLKSKIENICMLEQLNEKAIGLLDAYTRLLKRCYEDRLDFCLRMEEEEK